jgi:hypothetical protein
VINWAGKIQNHPGMVRGTPQPYIFNIGGIQSRACQTPKKNGQQLLASI